MTIETKELAVLKTQVSKLENRANAVTIESAEDYSGAVDILSILKEAGSQIKSKKESITKPLNEALKNARNLFAPIEAQYANAETTIKGKLLDYKHKVDEEARIKEAAIAKKVEDGKMKLETGARKMDEIERVEQTVRGKVGQVQVRLIKKVRIIKAEEIPDEYWILDQVAIRRDALGGKAIPGVEVYDEENIAGGR